MGRTLVRGPTGTNFALENLGSSRFLVRWEKLTEVSEREIGGFHPPYN
jgi:hypothetical protein